MGAFDDFLKDLGFDRSAAAPEGAGALPDGMSALQPASFFGTYQIIAEVGRGGIARVLRARHIHPHFAEQTFAVKVLHGNLSQDARIQEMFRREAYVLALLKHANIVQTFEAGEQDGELFIAMEYVDGCDLERVLNRCQWAATPFPIDIALHVAGAVLRALAYAHQLSDFNRRPLQLIHRDVNPANVFLSFDGRVKLGDFGVASIMGGKVEESREIAGKVGYFAPEQLTLGAAVDQRSDIFAVGVLLYEMLSGEKLFVADDRDTALRLNKRAKVSPLSQMRPDLDANLERTIMRALERKPDDRYPRAQSLLDALAPYLPPPDAMPFAVAGFLRSLFVNEYLDELNLSEGFAASQRQSNSVLLAEAQASADADAGPAFGNAAAPWLRGQGQRVDIWSDDEKACSAVYHVLKLHGYAAQSHGVAASVDLGVGSTAVRAVVVDVSSSAFDAANLRHTVGALEPPVPVIALASNIDVDVATAARDAKAVDLLLWPFHVERLLRAVRAAMSGTARIAQGDNFAAPSPKATIYTKVLLIARDPAFIAYLSAGLSARGLQMEVSPTVAEALLRFLYSSYHAVIFDSHPATPSDRLFASEVRAQPGIGTLPIVFLVDPEHRAAFRGLLVDRCAVQPRETSVESLAAVVMRMRTDDSAGRTFIRYDVGFAVELRYGGRIFDCRATDLSRGGVQLRSAQLPPTGTQVGLKFDLQDCARPVEAMGRVLRVDMFEGGGGGAALGIQFQSFVADSEPELISYIARLEAALT